jgi:hypothetical protein
VAGWTTTLANARTVIFPIDSGTVPTDSVEPIRAWLRRGGVAVFCLGCEGVARQLTGLNIDSVFGPTEDPWAKSSDGVASPLFAKGTAQLEGLDAAKAWTLDNDLPGEAASLKCLYGPTDNCALWVHEQGSGRSFGVAVDFQYFGYAGGQDGGWVSVMTTIAADGSPASQLTSWVTWVALALVWR